MVPKYFSSIPCVKMSYTMQAVKNVLPVYFLAKLTPVNLPEAMSTGHSIYNAYVIADHV